MRKMETKEKSVGIRMDRSVYDKAMILKEKAKEKNVGAAYSTQAWFSMLTMKGMEVVVKEGGF